MEALKTILVPHDLTKSSDNALRYAANLAEHSEDCHIIILHVIPLIPLPRSRVRREIIFPTQSTTNYLERMYEELEAHASRILESKSHDLTRKAESRARPKILRNFSISTNIAAGDNAAKKIVEYARRHRVDLIVMSSKSTVSPKNRIGGAVKVLLGSVSRAVSEMAPCPVLLVRPVQQY